MFGLYKNSVNIFPSKYIYKVTKLELLGTGRASNGGVYKFQIEYFLRGKLKKSIILAGKVFRYNHRMDKSSNFISILIKNKLISYSARKFKFSMNTVETTNFPKKDLEHILFLKDLSLGGFSIEPINKEQYLNISFLNSLALEKQLLIFKNMFLDFQKLTSLGFKVQFFDLWMIVLNEKEIRTELVDVEMLSLDEKNEIIWNKQLLFEKLFEIKTNVGDILFYELLKLLISKEFKNLKLIFSYEDYINSLLAARKQ